MSKKLEKINYIKNIGRFYDVSIQGTADSDPSFKKFNLIYADNGTGKSTISTILKSLCKNEPQRLIEKKTIRANGESAVSLQIGDENYIFQNGQWDKTPGIEIAIFDEEFVAKNVFLPSQVALENRRGLFNYAVLGEENVDKMKQIKKLNDFIKDKLNTKIKDAETKLKEAAGISDIKILDNAIELKDDELESLENNVNDNNKIIENEKIITVGKELEKITEFKKIAYEESISADLTRLPVDDKYQIHVQNHNAWIKDGMDILKNETTEKETCPFCREEIQNNNEAIEVYKVLFAQKFAQKYELLRTNVREQITEIESIYNEATISILIKSIESNEELWASWKKLFQKIPADIISKNSANIISKSSLVKSINEFKFAIESLLKRKKNNLLKVISPTTVEQIGLAQEKIFREVIANYNIIIQKQNDEIRALKNKSQNIEELKSQTEKDKIKINYNDVKYKNEEFADIYKKLEQNRNQKKGAEETIKRLRDEIEEYSKNILTKYEKNINLELEKFGVDFSIKEVKSKIDNTRKESIHFVILLKGERFDPNGSDGSPYKLSNTLSSGDRSTLAFAFFIAKHREKDISNQILVFDDPITSLDFFRKIQTKNIILKFSEKAAQVIVMTHSIKFAELFKKKKEHQFLYMQKNGSKSGVSCTLHDEPSKFSKKKYQQDYGLITKYIEDPFSVDKLMVARSIRPYVEATIEQYRPNFTSLTLGVIIGKFKGEGDICQNYIDELQTINQVTSPEHHGGLNCPPTDNELMKACEKAIEIATKPPPRCQNEKLKNNKI